MCEGVEEIWSEGYCLLNSNNLHADWRSHSCECTRREKKEDYSMDVGEFSVLEFCDYGNNETWMGSYQQFFPELAPK